jgi:hypothetical protein
MCQRKRTGENGWARTGETGCFSICIKTKAHNLTQMNDINSDGLAFNVDPRNRTGLLVSLLSGHYGQPRCGTLSQSTLRMPIGFATSSLQGELKADGGPSHRRVRLLSSCMPNRYALYRRHFSPSSHDFSAVTRKEAWTPSRN